HDIAGRGAASPALTGGRRQSLTGWRRAEPRAVPALHPVPAVARPVARKRRRMRNRASGAEGRHELVRWLARWLVALTAAGLALVSGCGAGEPPLTSDRLVDTSITLADQIAHGSEV